MTYRNLLHRLAKDLDDKELDQEAMVFNSESRSYHSILNITDVSSDLEDGVEKGQVVLRIGDL